MSGLPQNLVKRVGGFGNGRVDAYHFEPETVDDLQQAIEFAGREGRKIAFRGAGRSYGDAAILPEEIVLDCRRQNKLEIDPATGIATAECGVTIEDLWREGLPLGWWPPVVPGTMYPTMGGALAMNIHGKNNFRAGTLGEHVLALEAVDGTGLLHRFEKGDPKIEAIISSAGLLAAIVKVELQLKRVATGELDVLPVSCRNWDEQFAAFEKHEAEADYMVSWIDAHAKGDSEGRGQFHAAWHMKEPDPDSLFTKNQELPSTILGLFPKSEVWRILRRFQSRGGMQFLNSLKHFGGRFGNGKRYRQSLVAFSFLLDYAPGWEKSYAPNGFIQYQCFIPRNSAKAVFAKLFQLQREAKRENSLTVMKRHRPDGFLFSHAVDGYSLAMDFAIGDEWPGLQKLCWAMNEVVLDLGGRFYFAKDSTIRPEDVRRFLGEAAIEKFRELKREFDPDSVFETELGRRVGLISNS